MRLVDVVHGTLGLTFTWDSRKALANLKKHGIPFEAACDVLVDPFVLTVADEIASVEDRQRAIGFTADWQLLVVSFVLREDTIRIISARKATPSERHRYENQ